VRCSSAVAFFGSFSGKGKKNKPRQNVDPFPVKIKRSRLRSRSRSRKEVSGYRIRIAHEFSVSSGGASGERVPRGGTFMG